MRHGSSSHHGSRWGTGTYSTHLLLGWTASLGLLVFLVHLPLSTSSPWVGWSAQRTGDRIVLNQVSPPSSESPDETNADEEAPPPTQYTQPPEVGASGTGTDEEAGDEEESTSADSSRTSTVRHVSALTMADNRPRIIGGRGMLNLHIQYPPAAREKGIEGRMELTFTVDRDGDTRNIVVSKSLHPLCDSAAVDALRSVRFRPATYKGNRIPVRMSLPIRFQLQPTPPTTSRPTSSDA